ncbi:hypothetical protein ATANTOWER_001382 [Ataeniobius toweri]|uniref:Uncharacterized protein n=1 Tax=Ataeniobius toweri TaxID=208326 RepID=A0ABU7C747_9TELE|nr:hypothetical protein [Ataeniobius toweri]
MCLAWPKQSDLVHSEGHRERERGDDLSLPLDSFTVKAKLTIYETPFILLFFALRLIQLFHWDSTLPGHCLLFLFHFPFVSQAPYLPLPLTLSIPAVSIDLNSAAHSSLQSLSSN